MGLQVDVCPLLVLGGAPHGSRGTTRLLDPEKPRDVTDLGFSRAAVSVGFGNPGTATGAAGIPERDQALAETDEGANAFALEGMRAGRLRLAAGYDAADLGVGPVGGGSYSPVDGVAEIAGVGVLPAYRRRGLAGQLTYALVCDALASGVTLVFCPAQTPEVARVYEAVGFRRVGTACIVELPATPRWVASGPRPHRLRHGAVPPARPGIPARGVTGQRPQRAQRGCLHPRLSYQGSAVLTKLGFPTVGPHRRFVTDGRRRDRWRPGLSENVWQSSINRIPRIPSRRLRTDGPVAQKG